MARFFNFLGLVAFILSATLFSCKKNDNSKINKCNVSKPSQELDWLKQEINNVIQDEYSYYVMAKYKGETVFYYRNCNPAIDYVSIVKNCTGDNLGYTNDLYNELTEVSILWKHEGSKCNF